MTAEEAAVLANETTWQQLATNLRVVSSANPQDSSVPLTNDEARQLLLTRNSGLKPELSRRGYRFAKRAFDILSTAVAIALLAIPGAILCAAICIKSPGASPVYSQWRLGRINKDGSYRLFKMYKFRSMVPNADELLPGLQEQNEADGPLFKIKDDPRIIPGIGSFIRRHSIDELMQLVNVLKGDMTLIGPRPPLPIEVAQYDERAMRRLTVKPGCGGPWQASSRSDSTFEEMVSMDLDYIDHRSAGRDVSLVFRTVRTIFLGGGLLESRFAPAPWGVSCGA